MKGKKIKRILLVAFAFLLGLTNLSLLGETVSAEANVKDNAGNVTIENEYVGWEFSTASGKLASEALYNYRAGGKEFIPQNGSEEFIINLVEGEEPSVGDGGDGDVAVLPTTGWSGTVYNADRTKTADLGNMLNDDVNAITELNEPGNAAGVGLPYYAEFDLGSIQEFGSFSYLKRPGATDARWGINGTVSEYEFEISDDNVTWVKVAEGKFENKLTQVGNVYNIGEVQYVNLDQMYQAQYVRLIALSTLVASDTPTNQSFTGAAFRLYDGFQPESDGDGETSTPTPVDRTMAWTGTLYNSDRTKTANLANMLNQNPGTDFDFSSGVVDRDFPFYAEFDLGVAETFSTFSYLKRLGNTNSSWGINGTIEDYEFEISDDGINWTNVAAGTFRNKMSVVNGISNVGEVQYVNLGQDYTARYVRLVSYSCIGVASFSGGEFDLYSTPYTGPVTEDLKIKTSDLTLKNDGVIKSTLTDEHGQGVRVAFDFETYTFNDVDWDITFNVILYDDDTYVRSFIEIAVGDGQEDKACIDYIDQGAFTMDMNIDPNVVWSRPNTINYHEGVGQPIYVDSFFMGSEFPFVENRLNFNRLRTRYYTGKNFNQLDLASNGKFVTYPHVIGVAQASDYSVVQTDFFEYIESIATPTSFRIQYNSWYDNRLNITPDNLYDSFSEVEKNMSRTGVRAIDSYVVDDGWTYYNVDSQGNPVEFWNYKDDVFPDRLNSISDFVKNISSTFGLWLGPRGGYDYASTFANRVEAAGNGGKNSAVNEICVGDEIYLELIEEFMLDAQEDFNVEYWKLDGLMHGMCENESHGHMTGGYQGMYYYVDTWESWLNIIEELRKERDEAGQELFINATTRVPASPWMLQWVNTLWFQTLSGDTGYAGPTSTDAGSRMLTYRDNVYYNFFVRNQMQVPMKNIYNHDPVYGKSARTTLGSDPIMSADDFRKLLYGNAVRGTAFWELYYSYQWFDEEKWMINAEVLQFAEENIDILSKAKMVGPTRTGTVLEEPYAFSSWGADEGFVTVRNPSDTTKTFSLNLDVDAGVPQGISDLHMTYVFPNEEVPNQVYDYGDTLSMTLEPYELFVLKFAPKDTTVPEIIKTETIANNTIRITFDKQVLLNDISVDGYVVEDAELLADYRTVEITLEEGLNANQTVTGNITVTDNSGNSAACTFSDLYNSGRVVNKLVTKEDLGTGGTFVDTENALQLSNEEATLSSQATIDTDGKMNVSFGLKTDSTNAPVITQSNAYSVALDADGYLVFTVGDLSVKTTTAVNDNNLHDVIVVKELNQMLKIYIDGELNNSVYIDDTARPINAGKVTLGGSGFTGYLSNMYFAEDVNFISVTPRTKVMEIGNTLNLTAYIGGVDELSQDVVWSIEGNESVNTTISADGKLSVATDETATYITVKVTKEITADNDGLMLKGSSISGTATIRLGLEDTTPPVITGSNRTVYRNATETIYEILDLEVIDDIDGNITLDSNKVTFETDYDSSVVGDHTVKVIAVDDAGNRAEKQFTITVVEVATIVYPDESILVGSTFDPMSGVTIYDVDGSDITSKATVISSNVDTSKTGTYQVVYEVVDALGTTVTFTREVVVVNKEPDKVDRSQLEQLYNANINRDTSSYTEESKSVFLDTMKNVKAVLDNPNATQEEIDQAYMALVNAIGNLKSIDGGTGNVIKPGDPDSGIVINPPTGDTTNIQLYSVLLGMAVIVIGGLVYRKKKQLND